MPKLTEARRRAAGAYCESNIIAAKLILEDPANNPSDGMMANWARRVLEQEKQENQQLNLWKTTQKSSERV